MKKRWKGLRDSYGKHLRSLKTTSGQAAKVLNRFKSWPWASQMSFLKPHMELGPTETNVSSGDPEQEEDEASGSHEEAHNTSSQVQAEVSFGADNNDTSRMDVRKRKAVNPMQTVSNTDKVISFLQNRNPEGQDDIDLLFRSLAKTVKKFSPERIIIVKSRLAQYVMEQELAHLREENETLSFSRQTPSPAQSTSSNTTISKDSSNAPIVTVEYGPPEHITDISANTVLGSHPIYATERPLLSNDTTMYATMGMGHDFAPPFLR